MKKIIAIFMMLLVFSLPLASAVDTVSVTDETPEVTTTTATPQLISTDGSTEPGATTLEVDVEISTDAGITPDSALYFLDTLGDDIALALTFDDEAKAKLSLDIAEERLLEAEQMADVGNEEATAEAQDQYDQAITGAEDAVEAIESDGEVEVSVEALATVSAVQNRLEAHYEKVAFVKDRILERQRERMSEEQIAKLEAVFAKITERARSAEVKVKVKKENTKTKYKALSGKTDSEVDDDLNDIEEESGLRRARSERAEKELNRAKNALVKARGKLKAQKEAGIDVSDLEAKLDTLEAQIDDAESLTDSEDAKELAEDLKDFGNEISGVATRLGKAKAEGNFEQVKAELKAKIQERQDEHLKNLREKASERAEKVSERAEQVSERAGKVAEKATERAGKVAERAEKLVERAKGEVRKATEAEDDSEATEAEDDSEEAEDDSEATEAEDDSEATEDDSEATETESAETDPEVSETATTEESPEATATVSATV